MKLVRVDAATTHIHTPTHSHTHTHIAKTQNVSLSFIFLSLVLNFREMTKFKVLIIFLSQL